MHRADGPDPTGSGPSVVPAGQSAPAWRAGQRFRQLFAARLVSQTADGAFAVCLAGLVLFSPDKAPDATTLAADLAAVLLPFSFLGPFVGILLDRVDRRDVLVRAGVLRAALVGLEAVLLAEGDTTDVVAVAVMVLGVSRFVLSALSAALPLAVPTADLVPAGALSTTSGSGASLVGGGAAAGIRVLVGGGPTGLALVAAVTAGVYLLAGLTARRAPRGGFGPHAPRPWDAVGAEVAAVARQAADGARHLWTRRPAREALLAVNASRVCYGFVFVALLLIVRHPRVAGAGPATGLGGLGAIAAGLSGGTVVAAIAVPRLARRVDRQPIIAGCLVVAGLAVLTLCAPLDRGLFVIGAVVLGLATQGAKICSDAIVQREIDDDHRGRAFALLDVSFNVSYVAAAVIAALVLPADGRSGALLDAAGIAWLLTGAVYGARASQSAEHAPEQAGRRGSGPAGGAARD